MLLDHTDTSNSWRLEYYSFVSTEINLRLVEMEIICPIDAKYSDQIARFLAPPSARQVEARSLLFLTTFTISHTTLYIYHFK